MNEQLHIRTNRILASIALVLGIVCMVVLLLAAHRVHETITGFQDAFNGPTFPSDTYEPGMNPDDPGIPEEPWVQRGDEPGTEEFCDVDPDGVPYCESIEP